MVQTDVEDLRRKVEQLARHPGLTTIQSAFVEQLGEELAKLLLARQIGAEIGKELQGSADFIRQYLSTLPPTVTEDYGKPT